VRVSASKVDAWEDLKVGDRVRLFVPGNQNTVPDVYDVVELWVTDDVLAPDASDAIAVLRGPHGELENMTARMLRRVT
jgi:hypothetical protein